MTKIAVFAGTFLVAFTVGVHCLFRPQFVQAYVLRFFSKHSILSAPTLFKGLYSSPYYIVVLRIVGLGALIVSGVCVSSLISILR